MHKLALLYLSFVGFMSQIFETKKWNPNFDTKQSFEFVCAKSTMVILYKKLVSNGGILDICYKKKTFLKIILFFNHILSMLFD